MSFLSYLLLFAVVSTLVNGRFRCDYTYFNEADGYLKLHRVPANWQEARLRCHLEGASLASPLTVSISNAMIALMKQEKIVKCGVFTGVNGFFSKGDFHSIEGIGLSQIPNKWADDEPDNYKDAESCIMMLPDGTLADVSCSDPLPYMCYKKGPKRMITNTCGTIDPEYTIDIGTGSCYKFHRVPRTWSHAYMACAAEGGHLAIINSQAEYQVIQAVFAKNPANIMVGNFEKNIAFLGFHDWGEHGEWLTIEGQTLAEAGYANFHSGEPNNRTAGEFCGSIYRNGLLNDLFCEEKFPFICEKKPESLLCDNEE